MSSEQLRKSLKRLMRSELVHAAISGTVRSVDEAMLTCDVDPADGGPTLYDVRLKVSRGAQEVGCFSIPKVGSKVLVLVLDGNLNNSAVVQVEDIKEHLVRVNGGAELRIKPNGVVIVNGEQFGGLVKVQELRSELSKVNAFLATLRQAISAAPITPGDGGAAFKIAVNAAIASQQLPTYTDIENTKVKHGGV